MYEYNITRKTKKQFQIPRNEVWNSISQLSSYYNQTQTPRTDTGQSSRTTKSKKQKQIYCACTVYLWCRKFINCTCAIIIAYTSHPAHNVVATLHVGRGWLQRCDPQKRCSTFLESRNVAATGKKVRILTLNVAETLQKRLTSPIKRRINVAVTSSAGWEAARPPASAAHTYGRLIFFGHSAFWPVNFAPVLNI